MSHLRKKILALVTTCALAMTLLPTAAFATSIAAPDDGPSWDAPEDLDPNAWYSIGGYIDTVRERGIMNGYAGTKYFLPDASLTRAEMATALYRAITGDPDGVTKDPEKFATENTTGMPDVEPGMFYTAAVNYLYEKGYVTGYGEGKNFAPHRTIDRQEFITILARSADFSLSTYATVPGNPTMTAVTISCPAELQCADLHLIADWAKQAITWGGVHGIMNGNGDLYRPLTYVTRAEAAKMLVVYDNLVFRESDLVR